jgi:hypothetical protein
MKQLLIDSFKEPSIGIGALLHLRLEMLMWKVSKENSAGKE